MYYILFRVKIWGIEPESVAGKQWLYISKHFPIRPLLPFMNCYVDQTCQPACGIELSWKCSMTSCY